MTFDVLRASCPHHGEQRFELDEQREWYACPACPPVEAARRGLLGGAVIYLEDLARNPDGGDVRTLDP